MKRLILMAAASLFLAGGALHAQTDGKACCANKGEAKAHCADKSACADKAACDKKGEGKCEKGGESPTIGEARIIERDEIAGFVSNGSAVIFDARDAKSYEAGHIDGALRFDEKALPSDKNAALVFYCGSLRCPAAGKAAKRAIELGYTNVMVFKAGWAGWQQS